MEFPKILLSNEHTRENFRLDEPKRGPIQKDKVGDSRDTLLYPIDKNIIEPETVKGQQDKFSFHPVIGIFNVRSDSH